LPFLSILFILSKQTSYSRRPQGGKITGKRTGKGRRRQETELYEKEKDDSLFSENAGLATLKGSASFSARLSN
jgi:hypothetical protein